MTIETAILRDLLSGQSTACAIADRRRIPPGAAETILQRLQKEQQVTSHPLANIPSLLVYRLSPATYQQLTDPA